ncbi:hypothetical protein VNO78_16661 [Psophocarpus tetragonolobus]|uniref:Uncharacterized protein n=1 Tax=Psophocarpus tetragonolobus TaxID=3891 RepID=A0AAN9XKX9_PSOTE
MLLPAKPPFHPRQFQTCAVVGNSGDLLKTKFGKEIDSHDAVFEMTRPLLMRKNSNYNKWEVMPFESLRKDAQLSEHSKNLNSSEKEEINMHNFISPEFHIIHGKI